MSKISHDELGRTLGRFTWNFSMYFFIETAIGNFLYSCPDYEGDGSIKHYQGTAKEYFKGSFGRYKGLHLISDYCKNFNYNGEVYETSRTVER